MRFQTLLSWVRFARVWAQRADLPRHLLLAFFVTPSVCLLLLGTLGPELLAGSWIRNLADAEVHWQHRSAAMGREDQDVIAYRECVPPPKSSDPARVPPPAAPTCDDYARMEEPWPAMAARAGASLRAGIWTWYGLSALLYPVLLLGWRLTEENFRFCGRAVWSVYRELFRALKRP